MPRAFLITHRRYNSEKDGEMRESSSPEHKVSLPETPSISAENYDHYIEETTSSSDCPDELYNLTKLAEVSLAAASGQLYHHRHLSAVPYAPSVSPVLSPVPSPVPFPVPTFQKSLLTSKETGYTHKLFDRDRDRDRDRLNVVTEDCGSKPLGKVASGDNLGEGAQHECPDCGKRYSTSSNLARHRQTHRSLADKKARRCPHCDKVYVSMPAYSMHVRTHVQGCRCPYCGKCFSRPWLLQGHIRTHTGEKPFRCSVCQKAFADKSNLRAHVQTHSDTKPHVCGRCGKAFALKSYLYKHEESSCMRGQRSTSSELLSPQNQYQPPQISPVSPVSPIKVHHIQSIFQTEVADQIKPNPNSNPNPIPNLNSNHQSPGIVIAAPTPVIVRPNRVDRQFRSTVISPNPERAVLSFVERPTATATTGRCCVPLGLGLGLGLALPLPLPTLQVQRRSEGERNQDQPMDFSTNKDTYEEKRTNGGFTVGLAIAV